MYKEAEGPESKKVRHPKLIVSEEDDNFDFLGLTESPKRGHHANFPLMENPAKGQRDKPAYLREELRTAPKSRFGEPLADYSLSDSDKPRVSAFEKLFEKKKSKGTKKDSNKTGGKK